MESFIIEGGHPLSGTITPQGAKNEALEVICATLLTVLFTSVGNWIPSSPTISPDDRASRYQQYSRYSRCQ